jgi:protein-disulfide isomerase
MFRRPAILALCLLVAALPLTSAVAQGFSPTQRAEIVQIVRDALKADPSILRDAVSAMEADGARHADEVATAAIKALGPVLSQRDGDPVAGNPKGHVTVVEFYDVRCPYCRRMLPTLASLIAKDADVRIVYKDMPVLGPGSMLGAKALLAAQKQGGYQRLHDALMTGSPEINEGVVKTQAQRLGLDWGRLKADMDSAEIQSRIDFNLGLARRLELQGTPAYVIGGKLLPGAVDLAELQAAVAEARRAGG